MRARLANLVEVFLDVVRMAPVLSALLVPAGVLAAVARLLTSGLVAQFVSGYVAGGDPVGLDVLGFEVGADLSTDQAWAWIGVIAITGLAAAGLSYGEMMLQLRLGRRYAVRATEASLRALMTDRGRIRIRFDPMNFIRAIPALLSMVSPALQVLVFGTAMALLRPGLTGVLLGVGLLLGIPLSLAINRSVIRATEVRRSTSNALKGSSAPITNLLAARDLYDEQLLERAVVGFLDDEDVIRRYDANYAIRAGQERARLVSGVLWSVSAVGLAIGLTVAEDPGAVELADLLTFIIVAQFTFTAFGTLISYTARLAFFTVDFASYLALRRSSTRPAEPLRAPQHVGEVWLVRDKVPPAPAQLGVWLEAVGLGAATPVALAMEPDRLPDLRFEEVLTGVRAPELHLLLDARRFVEQLSGSAVQDRWLERPFGRLPEPVQDALRVPVALAPAALRDVPIVLVCSLKAFSSLDPAARRTALARLARHHVVFVGLGRDSVLPRVDRELDGLAATLPAVGGLGDLFEDEDE